MISPQRQKQLDEELLNAVVYGDKEIFQLCLKKGANINYQGRNGTSALHRAALNEQPKFVKLLIERGIDCNLKNWDRESALHSATLNKKTEIIKILIDSGINYNMQDKDGKSALHHATLNRKIEIVKALIDCSIDLNLQDKDGLTALHAATQYGYTKIANLLICPTGMNLNLQNKDGLTALHIATIEGNIKIVHLLIDKGIDMNIQEMHGWTALHSGAWFGKAEIMHLLIEKGIRVDLPSKDGSSVLHLAANSGNTEIAPLLIHRGIAINLQNTDGHSALHHAAWNGKTQFAQILIDNSIDLNLQDTEGFTALHNCALFEKEDIMQLLIGEDVDLNLQTKTGKTALHFAAHKNLLESVQSLIEHGCEKNMQDINGNTALHIVARNNNAQMVSYMLDRNCDPNIVNFEGKKPMEVTDYGPNKKLFKDFEKTLLPGLPVEVKKFDKKSAQVFASLLEQENYLHYESRVMLVGEHGTGKTTIARYLVGKSPTQPKMISTDGIELTNGLSYIDRENRTWLVGEQDFSLEEIATSRSLLHKVRIRKSDIVSTNQASFNTAAHNPKDPNDACLKPDTIADKHTQGSNGDMHTQGSIDEQHTQGSTDDMHTHGSIDHMHTSGSTDDVHTQGSDDYMHTRGSTDDMHTPGSTGDMHTQSITQPGFISRLKHFFGITKKVEEVKVTITKEKFFQMVSKVGKKMLHNKKIAPVVIWDFGGQDVFYSTHQTFLTYRALYIIVLDGSRKLDDPCPYEKYLPGKSGDKTARDYLLFWINTIVTYCKGSVDNFPKIMIVLTHRDKVQFNEVEHRRLETFREIRQMFKHTPFKNHLVIDDMIFVNAKDKHDLAMEKIKDVIRSESEKQPTWGEPLPKCFITLELECASLVKRNIPLITLEHLHEINLLQSIRPLSETELKVFLKFQHSIGKVLYFDEENLDTHVILSPTFLINAFKSIVTDRRFCEGDSNRVVLWDIMGKKGVVSKTAIQNIWKKTQYREFYKNKDYLLDVMTRLDILVDPKIYDNDRKRIPADFYYIASMVRTNDDSGYLQSAGFTHRSIAIAFQSSSLMIPPALSFRFISYCLYVWAVKKYGQTNKDMLFHRSAVFTVDPSLDLHILCEDKRIIARLVHARTNSLIMRDLASSITECLTSALEKISQLYIRASSDQHNTSNAFFITRICCNAPDNPCVLQVNEVPNIGEIWICPAHDIEHKIHIITSWFSGKNEDECKAGCPVTNEDFLKETPSELDLSRMSLLFSRNNVRELAIRLGLSTSKVDMLDTEDPQKWSFEILIQCRNSIVNMTFNHIKEAVEASRKDNIHKLCKLVNGSSIDFELQEEKWDLIPTEEHIDRLAPLVGNNSLPFLLELGMELQTWEQINYRQNERDLVRLNKDILEEWRNKYCTIKILKPTLRTIALAFFNIGKSIKIVENTLSDLF